MTRAARDPGTGFQSTPPRGWRRHRLNRVRPLWKHFNPLHREGGDSIPNILEPVIRKFQSTPPRGWRRVEYFDRVAYNQISIHSTARVETRYQRASIGKERNFNPLHREGGDGVSTLTIELPVISIHSTARVETTSLRITNLSFTVISIHSTARVETL